MFEFDVVICFGVRSALHAFFTGIASYSMFFMKIKYRLLMLNSEEYTDFQHLGSALELAADQRRYLVVNS